MPAHTLTHNSKIYKNISGNIWVVKYFIQFNCREQICNKIIRLPISLVELFSSADNAENRDSPSIFVKSIKIVIKSSLHLQEHSGYIFKIAFHTWKTKMTKLEKLKWQSCKMFRNSLFTFLLLPAFS